MLSTGLAAVSFVPLVAAADDSSAEVAQLVDAKFDYRLAYPADWKETGKPVKTHLQEVLYSSPNGYPKFGVTIDPVTIDSLEAFGTLDQVTERVLAVEATRDGVKTVTLRSNAAQAADAEAGAPSYYTIEYVTESSRGTKLFCCKYCIAKRKLYVLQTQAKLDAFDSDGGVRAQVRSIIGSFTVTT